MLLLIATMKTKIAIYFYSYIFEGTILNFSYEGEVLLLKLLR